ncbi:hypothetical protein [Rhizobium sp. Root1203]|uniref:hypothetical protein n=1 Tax=Rhizobium sp. Root1203 TaxID=1736427 RepID=UPI00191042B9|nr:hypothetical protein [Rhizobium sp. Root1203]
MIDIDDFLPEALRHSPNTSDLVAQRHILAAARELCARLRVWRETDTFEVTAPDMQGVCTYRDAAIEKIEAAFLNGVPLEPKTVAWLDENEPTWSIADEATGNARYVTQLEPNTVTVVPRIAGTMKIRLILKPARDAFSLPEFLLEDYSDEISRGAAARILTDANSTNPQLGLDHRAWFTDRLDYLAIKVAKGQQSAPLRTKGSSF